MEGGEKMKFGNNEVLEVEVFDETGKLVTKLNTLKDSKLVILHEKGYLFIRDALLDQKLLEYIGQVQDDENSDFEKALTKSKYSTSITFNKKLNKNCKLIGRGLLRSEKDYTDKEFLFEIPNAVTGKDFELNKHEGHVSDFDFAFTIRPYNHNGDLFKMHIE
jgi:hypothetical protein